MLIRQGDLSSRTSVITEKYIIEEHITLVNNAGIKCDFNQEDVQKMLRPRSIQDINVDRFSRKLVNLIEMSTLSFINGI